MKKILITGANSYIGTSFEKWVNTQYPEEFQVDTVDLSGEMWRKKSFAGYDIVFHVAGIAHQKETKENTSLYYKVNRDLAIETAKKAKESGVKQFIILSTMSVYGKIVGTIKKGDKPNPQNHYGKAKWQADKVIERLADESFKVAVLRPPMVYGKNCKGNYQTLRKFALKSPVFPDFENQRSMIFVENLAEFVKRVIDKQAGGLYFPQDTEYVKTTHMVRKIAENNHSDIKMIRLFNPFVEISLRFRIPIFEKVFGSLTYEKVDTIGLMTFEEIMKKVEL